MTTNHKAGTSVHSVPVTLDNNRHYNIHVGEDLISQAGDYCKNVMPSKRCIIITDKNVAAQWLPTLEGSLKQAGIHSDSIIVEGGEQSKSYASLVSVLDQILSLQPDRHTTLIALGGGVVGDLTGFCASITLRGVPFIQIPTTLLAQVDSSVGGKTGINTPQGKNLVGAFYQPLMVLADVKALATLDLRQVRAGYAEIVKYGLLGDAEFFAWLQANQAALLCGDSVVLKESIARSCQAKADIVKADEKEKGVRALLNLGHTFGHALEAECAYDGSLIHGEAVAMGMVLAFALSAKLGMCKKSDVELVTEHLRSAKLPVRLNDIKKQLDPAKLLAHMYHDKKVMDQSLVFILAHGIGNACIVKDITERDVIDVLRAYGE